MVGVPDSLMLVLVLVRGLVVVQVTSGSSEIMAGKYNEYEDKGGTAVLPCSPALLIISVLRSSAWLLQCGGACESGCGSAAQTSRHN